MSRYIHIGKVLTYLLYSMKIVLILRKIDILRFKLHACASKDRFQSFGLIQGVPAGRPLFWKKNTKIIHSDSRTSGIIHPRMNYLDKRIKDICGINQTQHSRKRKLIQTLTREGKNVMALKFFFAAWMAHYHSIYLNSTMKYRVLKKMWSLWKKNKSWSKTGPINVSMTHNIPVNPTWASWELWNLGIANFLIPCYIKLDIYFYFIFCLMSEKKMCLVVSVQINHCYSEIK